MSAALSVSAALLCTLGSCGSSPRATPAGSQETGAPLASQPAPAPVQAQEGRIEAQAAELEAAENLTPQATVDPGTLRDAQMVADAGATGGQAAALVYSGSSVRFPVPYSTAAGRYVVRVQARTPVAGGRATLALRRDGVELARVTVTSSSYSAVTFGTFSVAPGERLVVRLVGGNGTNARAALVDFLLIDPPAAVVQPAPAPAPAPAPTPAPAPAPTTGIKLPPAGAVAWDWQIGADSDSNVVIPAGVKLIDLDGFNISAAKVAQLRAAGLYTVCYINVGSWESYRSDSAQYPDYLKIQIDPDWPDEAFLDINDVWKPNSVLASILKARFKMCKDKGFDALEPDNLQNDENVRGGLITTQQQIDFNGWVADQAHAAGLAVFQKNGPDKILMRDRTGKMMVEKFDGILNEVCQQYGECAPLAEYVRRGKLALNVEYTLAPDCALSRQLNINTLGKDRYLAGGNESGYKRLPCN